MQQYKIKNKKLRLTSIKITMLQLNKLAIQQHKKINNKTNFTTLLQENTIRKSQVNISDELGIDDL